MRRLAAIVAAVTVVRLAVSAMLPLAPDETYYWIWSRALAPGYLDHPPMVALWISGGTALLGQTALGVRLFGPLAAALASFLLFDAAERLFPGRRAGLAAVLLLNATLLLGVGTVIMTPDSPLLFFWTATLWAMARLVTGRRAGWWLAAGLFAGLALDSKYTAVFLWIGIGSWVLLVPAARIWLRRWQPWAAATLGVVLFVPVLAWNAVHGWAGLLKQGGRVGDWQPMRAAGFLAELLGGQAGLATPWIWGLCMAALVVAARRAWMTRDPAWSLLAALSLPPVLVFVQHAIGDRVQGNWPAIIYPALAIAVAGWLAGQRDRIWIGASALGFAITALVYLQALFNMVPLPPRLDPIALRLTGWDAMARQVEAMRVRSGAAFVAADAYAIASELAWALPASVPVVGTDPRWALFDLPPAQIAGQTGLLLRDARRSDSPDPATWVAAEPIGAATRPGAPTALTVYRVLAGTAPPVAAALPRRN